MSSKIFALTLSDQNLLRVALSRAIEWQDLKGNKLNENPLVDPEAVRATTERIKDLKARLL